MRRSKRSGVASVRGEKAKHVEFGKHETVLLRDPLSVDCESESKRAIFPRRCGAPAITSEND